jgi:5-(carboxyamino)imidazole ribonucleotide synthase
MTTIGILGGGQLGRMLALAGVPLNLRFRFMDPVAGVAPVDALGERVQAEYEDSDALARFRDGLDVVTYEFENVPVATAQALAAHVPVFPPPHALEISQDRLMEKTFFHNLGIPTPPFAAVESRADLDAAIAQIGLPAVLKTRRMGYDGKGQAILIAPEDIAPAWEQLQGSALILEGFVNFDREVSVLAARSRTGEIAIYPLVQNRHREGILRRSLAPAPECTPELFALARSYVTRVLDELEYVGMLAIELFQVEQMLIANEMAPRVHNSGHWTIEGSETSQFEQHLRAILGLPLGSTNMRGHAAMINCIGTLPDPAAILAMPGAHLHLYDKAPRPGRKVGHITLRHDDPVELDARVQQVREMLKAGSPA